ncbi:MAG: GNAT family N-acetyltransferase [Pseudomonadota bacterium]
MRLQIANLDAPDFQALISAHAELMLSLSPPGSCHFFPIDGLKTPDVTVWELRDRELLLACGALKELTASHGEIKSMHTLASKRGAGLGRTLLEHILQTAKARGYTRLSLETGSMDGFLPARRLYEAYGFCECGPFGDYKDDPNSLFMTLKL